VRTYQESQSGRKGKGKGKAAPARRAPETKRRRDKEGSKQALLQAAVEIFATRGYDAATTREVAQKAGVAEGLIHRYYESKAGLLLAVLTDFQEEQMKCAMDLPPPSGGIEEEILAHFEHAFKDLCVRSDFARVVISRCIVDPAMAKQMRKFLFEQKMPVTMERLKVLQRDGKLDPGADLQALAYLIHSTCFSMVFLGHITFGLPEERVRAGIKLLAGLASKGVALPR
jgi:AcrR family transcriptional regulator